MFIGKRFKALLAEKQSCIIERQCPKHRGGSARDNNADQIVFAFGEKLQAEFSEDGQVVRSAR
jgi:hypothetical protein